MSKKIFEETVNGKTAKASLPRPVTADPATGEYTVKNDVGEYTTKDADAARMAAALSHLLNSTTIKENLYKTLVNTAEEINRADTTYGFFALRKVRAIGPESDLPTLIQVGEDLARITRRMKVVRKPLFSPGQIVATPGALDALQEAEQGPLEFLIRHLTGDWGDVPEEDAKENDFSVKNRFRIISAYHLKTGVKIWVITERDRSVTTLLLPEEY